jgi:flavin-dependent dehydrogenase
VLDLLILGAGPAGCVAAIQARRAGLSVLIVEAAGRARPVPGETLHPGIEPLFARLGLRDAVLAANFHRHHGIWIEWNEPRRFEAYGGDTDGPWLGFQADRGRLNEILLNAALELGTELKQSTTPEALLITPSGVKGIVANGSELRARWTADGTGRQAWLARQLSSATQRCSPPMLARFGWSDETHSDLDGQPCIKAEPHGWSWVAPLGGGRAAWVSLTVSNPIESCAMPIGTDVSWRIHRDCAGSGYFLLGDAAAVLDPLSSHGVLRATMSGMLCGHLAALHQRRQISERDVIDQYRSWLTQQFDADVSALSELYHRHPSEDLAGLFGSGPSRRPDVS